MKRVRIIIVSVILAALSVSQLQAQLPNSMFFMPNVPQSHRINPAIQPRSGIYFGFPVLSPLRMQFSSSALAFGDVLTYNSDLDALITPFHPQGDLQAFFDELQPVNYFLGNVGVSVITGGFRVGKSYISTDITPRIDATFYYPEGLFELPAYGFPAGETRSLHGIGMVATVFLETAIGWSRRDLIIPNLDIGVRAKLLSGLANVNTVNSDIEISTSSDELGLRTDMELSIAAPSFIEIVETDSFPAIEGDPGDYFNSTPIPTIIKEQLLGNMGLGLDIGVNYQPIPQLMVSASLLDLGYINWENTVTGTGSFEYEFNGVYLNPFSEFDTTFFQQIADSAMGSFGVVAGEPYRSSLTPKLFVGASFYPIERIGLGLLSRTDFLDEKITQQFTATANLSTGRFLNLSLSYTYMSNSPKNLGAGLSMNMGPFNMYLISDNIVSGALWPTETRSVNLWFGMNLCFGYRVEKKAPEPKDRPLIL